MNMRLRLFISFSLVVLATIGIVVLVVWRQTVNEVRTYMFRGGITNSDQVVTALENFYQNHQTWRGVGEVVSNRVAEVQGRGRRLWALNRETNNLVPHMRLADADGTLLLDTRQPNVEGYFSDDELARAIPLEVEGQTVGYLLPEGNQTFTSANANSLLSRLNRTAIIAALVGGGVSLLLAFLLARGLIRPVRNLTQAVTLVAEGDLTQRVPVHGEDEIAILGRTFNRMATSLQQAEQSRRALTADVAHELRTPLAVQRAHLEALQDGVYELSSENLAPVVEQNILLTRLVDDLRTLALADTGQLDLERTQTDLAALVQRVVTRFKAQAENRGIRLRFTQITDQTELFLDAQRIEQILHNLLDNALRHSPEGGQITLSLESTSTEVSLSVRDSGPGISEDALPHIFERFYRLDKARSRNEGGTGLGLSIARKLAQAHQGDLIAANHPEGGAIFTLILPFTN
jgi:signal transduction histidine kinase